MPASLMKIMFILAVFLQLVYYIKLLVQLIVIKITQPWQHSRKPPRCRGSLSAGPSFYSRQYQMPVSCNSVFCLVIRVSPMCSSKFHSVAVALIRNQASSTQLLCREMFSVAKSYALILSPFEALIGLSLGYGGEKWHPLTYMLTQGCLGMFHCRRQILGCWHQSQARALKMMVPTPHPFHWDHDSSGARHTLLSLASSYMTGCSGVEQF